MEKRQTKIKTKKMVRFNTKQVRGSITLGEQLKNVREEAKIDLDKLSKRISVKKEYLEYLESGEYLKLPGEVFVRNFILAYADYFELSRKKILELFKNEWVAFRAAQKRKVVEKSFVEAAYHKKSINLWRVFRYLLVFIIIAALGSYLGWEINNIVKAPLLEIESPAKDLVIGEYYVEVKGQTLPEANVTINGQLVETDKDGKFEEMVSLQPGINELVIISQKKHSKSSKVVRQILVKE